MLSSPSLMWQFSMMLLVPTKFNPVGVGRSRVSIHGEVADGDVTAVLAQPAMVVGRVLESDVVDEEAIAGNQVEHHGPDHFVVGAKRFPPGSALAVNGATPADFEVVNRITADESLRVGGAARISSQRQHLEHRVGVHLQVDAAEQRDGAAQERARRNLDDATARRVRCVDGVLNIGCVILQPVTDGAIVNNIENGGRNRRYRRIGSVNHSRQNQPSWNEDNN
jgi:hypothetical protein